MADVKKILASAKLPQTTVKLCLDGELAAAYAEAQNTLAAANDAAKKTDSLNSGESVRAAQDRIDELTAKMQPSIVEFVVRAVGRKRWTELTGEHSPRKDNAGDAMLGFNADTMGEALLREGIVDPQLDDDDMTILLDEHLSDGQYSELVNAVFFVNRRTVSVPS